MTKYRIVERGGRYKVQSQAFGVLWLDCKYSRDDVPSSYMYGIRAEFGSYGEARGMMESFQAYNNEQREGWRVVDDVAADYLRTIDDDT